MLRITTLVLGILSFTSSAVLASEQNTELVKSKNVGITCGWLPLEQLNALAPSFAPWLIDTGGPGACVFRSSQEPHAQLALTQMFQSSPVVANDYVKDLKLALKDDYKVEETPALGKHAFLIQSKEKIPRFTADWTAHQGSLVLTTSFFADDYLSVAAFTELEAVIKAALAGSQVADVKKSAATCDWIPEALAKKILTGANFRIQRFGSTTCMAADDSKAAIYVSFHESNDSPQVMESMRETAFRQKCLIEDVSGLGQFAFVESRCQSSLSAVGIHFFDGKGISEVRFDSSNKDASVIQAKKKLLIELAEAGHPHLVSAADAPHVGTTDIRALTIWPGAYRLNMDSSFLATSGEFCVSEETNRFISAEAWKAHFEKKGSKCEVSDVISPNSNELSWSGRCESVVLGKTLITNNEVRVSLLPSTKGFIISSKSSGDVQAVVEVKGAAKGKCRPDMPVYKPWG